MASRATKIAAASPTRSTEEASPQNISMAWQTIAGANKQIGELGQALTAGMFDERKSNLEAATDLAKAATDLLGQLQETRGANNRQVLQSYATIKAALIDAISKTANEQGRMNNAFLKQAAADAVQVGDTPIGYWGALAGTITEAGLVNSNYPGLAQLIQQALLDRKSGANLLGAKSEKEVRDIVDSLGINNDTAENITYNMFLQAWSNGRTVVDAERMLAQVQEMPDFTGKDPDNVSQSDVAQARDMLEGTLSDARNMYGRYASDAAKDFNTLYKQNELLGYFKDQAERAEGFIFSGQSESDSANQRMAALISNPEFRAWAQDYGFQIGNADFRSMDDFSYVQGRDDVRAVWAFARQIRHPRLPVKLLSPSRYTSRALAVTLTPEAYRDAEGNYYKDAEGNYLSRADVEASMPKSEVEVGQTADGVTYFRSGGATYALGAEGLVSVEAPSDLQWEPAYTTGTDGRPTPVNAADFAEGKPVDPTSIVTGIGLADVTPNVQATTEPPTPETVYGMEARRRAGQTSLSGAPEGEQVGANEVLVSTPGQGIRRFSLDDPTVHVRFTDPKASRDERREIRGASAASNRAARAYGVAPEGGASLGDRLKVAMRRLLPKPPGAAQGGPQEPAAGSDVAPEMGAAPSRTERRAAQRASTSAAKAAAAGDYGAAAESYDAANAAVPSAKARVLADQARQDAAQAATQQAAQAKASEGARAAAAGNYEDAAAAYQSADATSPSAKARVLADQAAADAELEPKRRAVADAKAGLKAAMEAEAKRRNAQAIMRQRLKARLAAAMEQAGQSEPVADGAQ